MLNSNGERKLSSVQPPNRKRNYLFATCLFLLFMQAGLLVSKHYEDFNQPSTPLPDFNPSNGAVTEHPISTLIRNAEQSYRSKVLRQSQSLKAAVKEYQRRYNRPPPRGFKEWWEFAVDNNVKMVDEFDSIHDDLLPFWEISGEEFKRRATQVS